MITKSLVALSVITLAATSALAAPVPFYTQNFDALTTGTINGQDGWFGAGTDVVQSTTAVSGKALEAVSGPGRADTSSPLTFSTAAADTAQRVSFDFLMDHVVTAGTANQSFQETVQFRGPRPFENFFLVYQGSTNSSGVVNLNAFQFRGNVAYTSSANTVQANTWYHVVMDENFVTGPTVVNTFTGNFTGTITTPSGIFFAPGAYPLYSADGNKNYAAFFNQPSLGNIFIDNLEVDIIPEPASLALLTVAIPLLFRRRRNAI